MCWEGEGRGGGRWQGKRKVEGDSEEGEMRGRDGEERRREGKRGERGKGERRYWEK